MVKGRCYFLNLGLLDYGKAYALQEHLIQERKENKIEDVLLLLEHPPVITLGRNSHKKNILASRKTLAKEGIKVIEVNRGGDVTYHCPGQLIGYPIISLNRQGKDIHKNLRNLEEVIIRLLKDYKLNPTRKEGATGVWVEEKKIASLGIKVSKWISYHGFSLNVNVNLRHFSLIKPCGIPAKKITSLKRLLQQNVDISLVREKITKYFGEVFNLEMKEVCLKQ